MKKSFKKVSKNFTLGDLILAVSSQSRNSRETLAAVTDLLESGRVRVGSHKMRARVF
jgi:hypothetical protein